MTAKGGPPREGGVQGGAGLGGGQALECEVLGTYTGQAAVRSPAAACSLLPAACCLLPAA